MSHPSLPSPSPREPSYRTGRRPQSAGPQGCLTPAESSRDPQPIAVNTPPSTRSRSLQERELPEAGASINRSLHEQKLPGRTQALLPHWHESRPPSSPGTNPGPPTLLLRIQAPLLSCYEHRPPTLLLQAQDHLLLRPCYEHTKTRTSSYQDLPGAGTSVQDQALLSPPARGCPGAAPGPIQ